MHDHGNADDREQRVAFVVAEVFAQNLQRIRRGMGLNQEQLAARAVLHRTEISLLERAGRIPRIDTMLRIAGALEAEPNELLAGIAWTPVYRTHFDGSGWVRQ